ncbi:MAG TPA: hypothetical protein DCG75_01850 [Bacteroidales bacterium]|nr:hypothetical protein [Bacteroidales bacterium]
MITYDFIEKMGSIQTKFSTRSPIKYLTLFDEFENEIKYKEQLENCLKGFRHEIQSLPFKLPIKQARKVFLNNLYDEFLLAKEKLYFQFNQAISKSHECVHINKGKFKYYLPRFLLKQYLTKVRLVNQKLFLVYYLQNDIIENAIEILKNTALNDGIELKVLEINLVERVKTNLSSSELSYFFFLILQKVSIDSNFNRSNLSKILADNFSTKKTISPQANQIRKHFTEVNDNVKNKVEKLFLELSNNANSNYL